MADGMDEAREAFATELDPQAPARPRDTSGRFQSTRAPEAMFEPRPVEGDPLTGDTRDGGEDQRLVERQRTAAEHDDAPPQRVGGEDDEGEAEAKPGEGEGEGEGEGGEEADDKGPRYEVTVDGQTQEVSLQEALKGYIREQTFHQRMNKVSEARQQVEQEASTTLQARDAYVQRLDYLQRVIKTLAPQEFDWDKEFSADPAQARVKQKAFEQVHGTLNWVAQEMQREAHERQQEYEQRASRYAVDQFSQFVQEANIPDEKALNGEMAAMRNYGKACGFTEGELATTYDKRMLRVLRDAAKYHQMMSARPKAVIPGKGKTLTPGVATPVGNATRRSIDEAQQRLAKTGRLDDASLVFQRLLR